MYHKMTTTERVVAAEDKNPIPLLEIREQNSLYILQFSIQYIPSNFKLIFYLNAILDCSRLSRQ